MTNKVKVNGLEFELFIEEERIKQKVKEIADLLNMEYKGKNPIVISILNGAFIFTADLIRLFEFEHQLEFVKLQSYQGTQSTGQIEYKLKLEVDIIDRDILIVEDIVDTGNTLGLFKKELERLNPNSIAICSLLSKPEVHQNKISIAYCGFEIPNDFIIGYGLDLDGKARYLKNIYKIISK